MRKFCGNFAEIFRKLRFIASPDPPFCLAFLDFLVLFSFSDFFLAFCCVFPSFSKDFMGSAKRKTLAFLGKNPCFFQKSKVWRVRVRKGCGNSAESLRKFRGDCGNFSAMTPSRTTPPKGPCDTKNTTGSKSLRR